MAAETILAKLPGTAPYERLVVALKPGRDGRLAIDLREQHYAEGIGWFDQRSLALDPRQLQQLLAVVGMKAREIEAAQPEAPATIPFPGPDGPRPSRRAASS